MRTNTIYFMIGVPGSGKSTVAQKIVANYGPMDYINPDSIRAHLTGTEDNFSAEGNVWDIVRQRIAHACRAGRSCVLDATGANLKLRQDMVRFMKSFPGTYVQAVYCKVSLAEAKARATKRALNGGRDVPEDIIEKMWNALDQTPPTRFDGFDQIDVIT